MANCTCQSWSVIVIVSGVAFWLLAVWLAALLFPFYRRVYMNWISVDILPPNRGDNDSGDLIIAYQEYGGDPGTYYIVGWFNFNEGQFMDMDDKPIYGRITHWADLTDPNLIRKKR